MGFLNNTANLHRLNQISKVIEEYAVGNFATEAKVSLQKDELDAIAQGINVLGQNLEEKVTSYNTLKSILDNSPQLTIITDLSNKITEVNKKGLELLCMNQVEVVGRQLSEIVSIDNISDIYQKIFNQDNCYSFEVRVNTGYQAPFPSLCSASVIRDYNNQITGIIFQFQDISEFKKAQELELKNKELELFSCKVAHDIRSPIKSVVGLLEHLIKEGDEAQIKKMSKLFYDTALFLDDTVDSLLKETALIEVANRKEVCIDFDKLVKLNEKALALYAKEKVAYNITFDDTTNTPLYSQEEAISSIMRNLIQNAYKYRREEVALEIKVSLRNLADMEGVELCIGDNGIGIAPESQQQIFELGSRFTTQKSTGYGMYFVKKAVEKIKGTITIESTLGVGTCFRLKLPNYCKV